MSNCFNNCKMCNNLVISSSVSIITVDGVATLVVDIPQNSYAYGRKVCLVVAQTIPEAVTINMPVAISIGGVTTTVYPVVTGCCTQVTACALRTRTRYPFRVILNGTGTGAVFKSLGGLSCYPKNNVESIPVPTETPTGG